MAQHATTVLARRPNLSAMRAGPPPRARRRCKIRRTIGGRGLPGRASRSRGPVLHRLDCRGRQVPFAVALSPVLRRGDRDLKAFGGAAQRPVASVEVVDDLRLA